MRTRQVLRAVGLILLLAGVGRADEAEDRAAQALERLGGRLTAR